MWTTLLVATGHRRGHLLTLWGTLGSATQTALAFMSCGTEWSGGSWGIGCFSSSLALVISVRNPTAFERQLYPSGGVGNDVLVMEVVTNRSVATWATCDCGFFLLQNRTATFARRLTKRWKTRSLQFGTYWDGSPFGCHNSPLTALHQCIIKDISLEGVNDL